MSFRDNPVVLQCCSCSGRVATRVPQRVPSVPAECQKSTRSLRREPLVQLELGDESQRTHGNRWRHRRPSSLSVCDIFRDFAWSLTR
jgi:hypothetical protein